MKRWIAKGLLWTWAIVFVLCLYAVFFVSWTWTIAIVVYVVVSVLVLHFMAPQSHGQSEQKVGDDNAR